MLVHYDDVVEAVIPTSTSNRLSEAPLLKSISFDIQSTSYSLNYPGGWSIGVAIFTMECNQAGYCIDQRVIGKCCFIDGG